LAEALVEVDPHLIVLHVEVDEVVGLEGRAAHHGEQFQISEQLLAADAQLAGQRLHRHPPMAGDVGDDEEQAPEPLVDVAHAAPWCRAATASASARKRARAVSGDTTCAWGDRASTCLSSASIKLTWTTTSGSDPRRSTRAPGKCASAWAASGPSTRSRTSTGGSIRHCQGACGTWASMSNPSGIAKSWVRGLLGFIFSPRMRWTWKVRSPCRRWQ